MSTKIDEIKLSGLSTSPLDYDNRDGNLAVALGVVHEDGSIKSASATSPKLLINLSNVKLVIDAAEGTEFVPATDIDVMYIHSSSYKHVIIKAKFNGEDFYRYAYTNITNNPDELHIEEINSFNEIQGENVEKVIGNGNTLIFLTNTKKYYYIWSIKEEEDTFSYHFLSDEMPRLDMAFSLTSHVFDYYDYRQTVKLKDEVKVKVTGSINNGRFSDIDVEGMTAGTWAVANTFTGEWADENGYFTQPFLVRYAFRLYDGTLSRISAPVLMIPAEGNNPIVFINSYVAGNQMITLQGVGVGCQLRYSLLNQAQIEKIKEWKDIIKNVEIFVSQPIYTYYQNDKIKSYDGSFPSDLISDSTHNIRNCSFQYKAKSKHTVSNILNGRTGNRTGLGFESLYQRLNHFSNDTFEDYETGTITKSGEDYFINGKKFAHCEQFDHSNWTPFDFSATLLNDPNYLFMPTLTVDLPTKDVEQIQEEIQNTSVFYFLKSYDIDELLEYNDKDIKVYQNTLNNIVNRETLEEDYDADHYLLPKSLTAYNHRLNLTNIRKRFFEGFDSSVLFADCKNYSDRGNTLSIFKIVTHLNSSVNNIRVVKDCIDKEFSSDIPIMYAYYPDPLAYKMVLYAKNEYAIPVQYYKAVLPLKVHSGLNGSYYCYKGEYTSVWQPCQVGDIEQATEIDYQDLKSSLYTSEVDNPFVFKAKNVEQVGDGEIIALKPAAVALSQGQFGEYPMYCFTSEGIWALSVSNTGGWSAKQPISRDIPLSEEMVLQMDRDIIFATARGLMAISGSKTECVSEVFDGVEDLSASQLPNIDEAFRLTNIPLNSLDLSNFTYPFRKFLNGGNILFDYSHQRTIVGNPNENFAYLFSLKDRLWTTIAQRIIKSINSYTQCYAITLDRNGNKLMVDFADLHTSSADADSVTMPTDGLIITRPITLDDNDTFKTIRAIVARGTMDRRNVDIVLYGSRDLNNWFLVGSCKGNILVRHKGTPYRYFKVCLLTHLGDREDVSKLTIEYESKLTNKLR